MAKREEVMELLTRLHNCNTQVLFDRITSLDKGSCMVMEYLYDKKDGAYASTIASFMNVSRSRVGIIVNKLKQKELVYTKEDENDGRIDIILLTEKGINEVEKSHKEVYDYASILVDRVGIEELNKMIDVINVIENVLKENNINNNEINEEEYENGK